jgi:hypothetical protein
LYFYLFLSSSTESHILHFTFIILKLKFTHGAGSLGCFWQLLFFFILKTLFLFYQMLTFSSQSCAAAVIHF